MSPVGDVGRFAYEPVLNLLNGRPVGVEVLRLRARDQALHAAASAVWGTRALAEFDSGIAIASVLHGTAHDPTAPLHVDVLADTVVAAPRRVRELRAALQRGAPRRPAPTVVLDIGPALSAAPPDAFARALAELREDGFSVAFDGVGRGFGLDLVAELRPDLVKIDAHLVARLPGCSRARVVVTALTDVCRAVGVRVSANGVHTADQLAAVRDHGIPWAQGPLLAAARSDPSLSGVVLPRELVPPGAPPPNRPTAPAPSRATSVAALAQVPLCLPHDAPADAVRHALVEHPHARCVVLLDAHRRPTGVLARDRFLREFPGPSERAKRPAHFLAEPPRTVPAGADARAALGSGLADPGRTHDDLVVVGPDGACTGVVRVRDLIRQASGSAA